MRRQADCDRYFKSFKLLLFFMNKSKPIAVKGYPICSHCHPEQNPQFNAEELSEGGCGEDWVVYCNKCNRVVFKYEQNNATRDFCFGEG